MVVIYDLKQGSLEIDDFNYLLKDNNRKVAYVVHKPGCHACHSFLPNWNIFQQNIKNQNKQSDMVLAKINVDVLSLVNLKNKETIIGVPHISLQNKNKIFDYNGNRTPEDLERWFVSNNIYQGGKKRRQTKKRKFKRSKKPRKKIPKSRKK
jgi:hypothetical protein